MSKDDKMRLQLDRREWMDILTALNSAMVNAKKQISKNKNFELMLRSNIASWTMIQKKIRLKLEGI